MHRLAAVLTILALGAGLAACGGDDEDTPTTAATTETTRGYTDHGDEPFSVEATIEEVAEADGNPVLTAKDTEGTTYKVLVPPDVTLDATAAQVFDTPDCGGKVLANLELVAAPDHEEAGDHVLVSASIDTESCL